MSARSVITQPLSPPTVPDRFSAVDDPDELAQFARPVAGEEGRREVILAIDGIHCAACSVAIEQALAPLADRVEVNVAARRARLVWQPGRTPLSDILRAIAGLRYTPRPMPLDALDQIDAGIRRAALWRMLVGLLCMMQVMMIAVPRYVAGDALTPDLRGLFTWAELMLSAPVLLFAAGPFFAGAWQDARRLRIGMDTPIALGIAVTFGTSLVALGRGEEVYFDSVTMFVALLLTARWLESIARERAAAGLAGSLARLPETAERITADGRLERISRRRLRAGDRVSVPAGATMPADGVIATGDTAVDESLLTGESRPLARGVGDAVVAGSLNLRQPIEMTVTRGAAESRLAELHRLVERASTTKPALLRAADRFAGPFLVGIIVAAGLTWLGWSFVDPVRAPWIAASVLIVTCPCALALAAPSALLAALGALARRGIIVAASDTLETLAHAEVAVFDKTGTLTTEVPTVSIVATDGLRPAQALAIAAALERSSLHPVARAFASARALAAAGAAAGAGADERPELQPAAEVEPPVAVTGIAVLPGGGLTARIAIEGRGFDATIAPHGDLIRLLVTEPGSRQLRSADFRLVETVREDARTVIDELRGNGLACLIASGDHPQRVGPLARALGVDAADAVARATPEMKLALVEARQRRGLKVMMVGDGVNDAPVLRQADVSFSFAGAAPLARHQADVLLINDRLESILVARRTARKALRIVRQNFAFSVAYNLAAIPLAIGGLLPPWLAGLGMAASSLVVVLNALRAGR